MGTPWIENNLFNVRYGVCYYVMQPDDHFFPFKQTKYLIIISHCEKKTEKKNRVVDGNYEQKKTQRTTL